MIKYTLTLILLAGTLQAQESDSNDAKATLPELAVQGSSMGKIDLSLHQSLAVIRLNPVKLSPYQTFPVLLLISMLIPVGNNHLEMSLHCEELAIPSFLVIRLLASMLMAYRQVALQLTRLTYLMWIA